MPTTTVARSTLKQPVHTHALLQMLLLLLKRLAGEKLEAALLNKYIHVCSHMNSSV